MPLLLIEEESLVESHNWRPVLSNRNKSEQAAPAPQTFISDARVTVCVITSTLIVCGNCAGEAELPHKTFLTSEGRCQSCGGRSYVFASEFSKTNTWRQIWQQQNNQLTNNE